MATNTSSRNHGRPATLNVTLQRSSVRLTHHLDGGGNEYDIDRQDALPALVAQLIPHCPKSALPQPMGAIGSVIAADAE